MKNPEANNPIDNIMVESVLAIPTPPNNEHKMMPRDSPIDRKGRGRKGRLMKGNHE